MKRRTFLGASAGIMTVPLWAPRPVAAQTVAPGGYGVGVAGAPALPADFQHFTYVNPDAPKGGSATFSEVGGFDSFNPFIIRGNPAAGASYLWDTLLRPALDEAAVAYGLIAETVAIAPDHGSVTFTLRPEAKFADGSPVRASDVVWSYETLCAKGQPFYQQYYAAVASAAAPDDHTVVFTLKPDAPREMALILGQLTVLPAAWWKGRDFTAPLTEVPLGSGPYTVAQSAFNRSITYRRRPDYWAKDLPVCRGFFNFDAITYEYFGDPAVALQAFKAGDIDFRNENIAKIWATAYDFPAAQSGLVQKRVVPNRLPTGMQGFGMNTRRAVFADPRVRQAIAWAYDFEWANKVLFYGGYERTLSYFSNSDLACSGLPQGAELALLEPFRGQLPPQLFTEPYVLPPSDASGRNRENLRAAQALLAEAGWTIKDNVLVDGSGTPFRFEILLQSKGYQRIALAYADQLRRLGIQASVRLVESAQYARRIETYDFDVILNTWITTLSPGVEQSRYWGSGSADVPGTRNYPGVKSPVVDALIKAVTASRSQEELQAAVHALDRVLLWGNYVVPLYYLDRDYVAYWGNLGRVTTVNPTYGTVLEAWWSNGK